jgi:2-hydroxy-3-keto-5-methylthiopentenyl-1-phosphate phosphatase
MAQQVGLLEATRAEMDAHLDDMSIDRAFPHFAAAARAAGVPLTIVSDGLDYAIRRILSRHGLDDLPVVANRLQAVGAQGWRLDFPYGKTGCRSGNCKCACADTARMERKRVLLIGDGASDFCVAGEVDLVFAKHRLIEHCRAAAIPYVPITGFADALDLLPTLVRGEITAHHGHDNMPHQRIAAAV